METYDLLDELISTPRLLQVDRVDLAAAPLQVWQRIRHGDLAPSPLIRALFAIRAAGKPWVEVSWLFFVEPLEKRRARLISRYRAACSDDLATRLAFGPMLVEPVGFAMDRRMLLGIKARAEHSARSSASLEQARPA